MASVAEISENSSWQTELPKNPPTVEEIQVFEPLGKFPTKSDTDLIVLFELPLTTFPTHFFKYDTNELEKASQKDIRGLRQYNVRELLKDKIGGTEFHRVRQEIISWSEGKLTWTFEDLFGNTKEMTMDKPGGVYLPPFILHTYQPLVDNSGLWVLANTLFIEKKPFDTFQEPIFRQLQKKLKAAQI